MSKRCQFCDSKHNIISFIPGGEMCKTCKKALDTIRTFKLGIPLLRITKERHNRYRFMTHEYEGREGE